MAIGNRVAICYISNNGFELAQRLSRLYPEAKVVRFKSGIVPDLWQGYKSLVFIMAAGIVVRSIAHLIKDKRTDPAVVVLDENGDYAVSLLSGHQGGANDLAREIAGFLKGQAVITTASEVKTKPKRLVIGIGCKKGTTSDEIEDAVNKAGLSLLSISSIATIDRKADEPGLSAFAQKYSLKINSFTQDELNRVKGVSESELVFKLTGAKAVAEPAALLASGANKLLVPKQRIGNVTVAVAENRGRTSSTCPTGKLYIVGIGPGDIEQITPYAGQAIANSDVVVGYDTYLSLIQELIRDKQIVATGMTREIERCQRAIELTISGKRVCLISGGDPGIYAMAGLVFEMLQEEKIEWLEIEVIPGIPALNASASRLGAPLMHDFACISLSDRLTKWELIEKRLESAAIADFVIVLYNPKSQGRQEHIHKAQKIILKHRAPQTPVGIVRSAMRRDERIIITNLKDMLSSEIDMQTTVIIGNSQTFVWKKWMITPRGYAR